MIDHPFFADHIFIKNPSLKTVVTYAPTQPKKPIASQQSRTIEKVNSQKKNKPFVDLPCPECGSRRSIYQINISRCTAIGGGWKTILICKNSKCRNSELSYKTLEEWKNGHNNP